ncbi:MAG: Ldh family oxidoreductase [Rhodopila sp.]|nr:Ldh family oxidoreductase [Rhodopila sp.]
MRGFVRRVLEAAGVDAEMASPWAARMIDADLLGYSTHGIAMLRTYLDRIEAGGIARSGKLEVVSDHPASFCWQAHRLSGAWAMAQATTALLDRAQHQPVVTGAIANCSHIGCLQSYLLPFVQLELVVLLSATNPGVESVAPFGGTEAILTTNPFAVGIPTRTTPILIDQSTSVTSNSAVEAYRLRGEKLPGRWLLDNRGQTTDDPAVLGTTPPGSIMPLGGETFGYKGFGFGLMVEALALALPGYGRRSRPDRFGQGVFVQVINPANFCGREAFLDEIDYLVGRCHASPPVDADTPVRLPGERALANMQRQEAEGVGVPGDVLDKLTPWLRRLSVEPPHPIAAAV